ncbi:MAG: hypothetical protein H6698_02080 [Myxococcales bacterium]|nr:hypothetical protein [Myxococcales bacterium]
MRTSALACAVIAALTLPAVAHAQRATGVSLSLAGVPTSAEQNSSVSEISFDIEACLDVADALNDGVRFAWTLDDASEDLRYAIKINPGTSGCASSLGGSDDASCDVVVSEAAQADSLTQTIDLGDIVTGITSSDDCFDSTSPSRYEVHLFFEEEPSDEVLADDVTAFTFDLTRPSAPTEAPSLSAGETSVSVSWTFDDDSLDARVFYATEAGLLEQVAVPEELPSGVRTKTATGSSIDITGLETGATVYVAVAAVESSGNVSLLSPAATAVTAPTTDFFELYKQAGGVEEGGCAAAPGTGTGAFGALLFGAALAGARRRRGAAAAAVGAGIALVGALAPSAAHADIVYAQRSTEITSMFELKLGMYEPNIDAEFDGEGPYSQTFGSRNPLLLELEYDYQLWRGFGSAGVYAAAGWRQVRGNALALDGTESTDRTRLLTLPFRLGAVYRFDVLQERFNVPIALALKAGLDYTAWFVRNEEGIADYSADGSETFAGRGGTTGYHVGAGVYLLLDFLAPKMATSFDESAGVNNTYLFAEVTAARLDDFGGKASWDLSDTSLMFGLAFEF